MTTLKSRQPTKLDYASPTQFKFNILKLPKTEYFCTAVNIPGISLAGTPVQQTMLKDKDLDFLIVALAKWLFSKPTLF